MRNEEETIVTKSANIIVKDVEKVDYDALIEYLKDHYIDYDIEDEQTDYYDTKPDPYDAYADWCAENDYQLHTHMDEYFNR